MIFLLNQTHSISHDACSCLCHVMTVWMQIIVVQALVTSEAPLSKAKQLELCETIMSLLESPLSFGIEIRS